MYIDNCLKNLTAWKLITKLYVKMQLIWYPIMYIMLTSYEECTLLHKMNIIINTVNNIIGWFKWKEVTQNNLTRWIKVIRIVQIRQILILLILDLVIQNQI